MVGQAFRVAVPYIDRMRHKAPHRRLEIIVADNTAGNTRGAGGDPALLQDHDAALNRLPAFGQALGKLPGSRYPVDPCANDDVIYMFWKSHVGPAIGLWA